MIQPRASFGKAAYAIPEVIGNKILYLNYECDECNDRFSAFEDDFSKFSTNSVSITLRNKVSFALCIKNLKRNHNPCLFAELAG